MNVHHLDTDKNNEFLDELMYLYGKDVWNLAYSLTRQADQADDVTQDVFLKVYKKIDTFRADSSMKTWLLKITRNTAYDHLKSSFLKKVILLGNRLENGSSPSAEHEALDKVITDQAWKVVLQLPLKYREVLVLYGHHNLTVEEIANTLQVSQSTVKTRLVRARTKAADLLKEVEADESN